MAVVTFDTLKFVETLEKAGISREQASAFSTAVKDLHEAADVVTKTDLRELDLKIDAKFLAVDARLAEMRGEMLLLKWMMGVLVAGVASLVLKAFF